MLGFTTCIHQGQVRLPLDVRRCDVRSAPARRRGGRRATVGRDAPRDHRDRPGRVGGLRSARACNSVPYVQGIAAPTAAEFRAGDRRGSRRSSREGGRSAFCDVLLGRSRSCGRKLRTQAGKVAGLKIGAVTSAAPRSWWKNWVENRWTGEKLVWVKPAPWVQHAVKKIGRGRSARRPFNWWRNCFRPGIPMSNI